MVNTLLKVIFLFTIFAPNLQAQSDAIANPVLDAKQAFHQGIKEFVGVQLAKEMLLPGIKAHRQTEIRKQYSIRPLNRNWRTLGNIEQNPKRLYQLKRYANRYNLTIDRLIKQEKLEQKQRYRY